jgi:diamine N-acetyltransferase
MGVTFGDALAGDVVGGVHVVPWYRVIEADGGPVGFLMIAESTPPGDIPFLWRLLVDRMHQGRGIGTRALALLVARLRDVGKDRLHVGWYPGPGSPERFYRTAGFVPDGRVIEGQVIAELLFDRLS